MGCVRRWESSSCQAERPGPLTEGREVPGAERGNPVPPVLQRLPRSRPGAVVRDWAGWAEAEAGAQAGEAGTEERISYTRGHAARTATTCHSWPPFRGHSILPTDRREGGRGWGWGRVVLEQAEEKKEGAPGAPGHGAAAFSQALAWTGSGRGLDEEGLSGRAEGQDHAQTGPWLCPPAPTCPGSPGTWLEPHGPRNNHPGPSAQLCAHELCLAIGPT